MLKRKTTLQSNSSQIISKEGAIAILLALLLAVVEMSWWVRGIFDVAAILLVLHLAWRLSLHISLRLLMIFASLVILIALTKNPILEDFHKRYSPVDSMQPKATSINMPHKMPEQKPLNQPLAINKDISGAATLQSTAGRMIYSCEAPQHLGRFKTKSQKIVEFKRRAQAIEGTFGISITYDQIPGGIRIDIKPNSPETKLRMYAIISWTLEIRRMDQQLLVVSIMNFPAPLDIIFGLQPVDKNSDEDTRKIEKLLGLDQGKCRLV